MLVTGGSSQCGFTDEAGAVFAAELWDPATGQWTTMANAGVVRVYHSTTVLLPDGRVLSTGSGDGGGVTQQYSYEIFSPPYLFKGARPTYNLAPGHALRRPVHRDHAERGLDPEGHAHPARVLHPRLRHGPAAQHARLPGRGRRPESHGHAARGRELAPPGPYLLFIINDKGVPSVAQTVLLSP